MPDNSSEVDPGFEIKYRIVGALVLISAAIVILPEILREPGPAEPPVKSQSARPLVQNQEVEGFVSTITAISNVDKPQQSLPLSQPKLKQSATTVKKPVKNSKQVVPSKPVLEAIPLKTAKLEEPKPIEPEAPKIPRNNNTAPKKTPLSPVIRSTPTASRPTVTKKESKPKAEKRLPPKFAAVSKPAEIERGWEIRIGTFAQPDNAKRIIAVLRQQGFDPHQTKIKTDKGTVIRVWVGPFATRVTAGRTRASIAAKTTHKGWIAPYP